MTKEMTKMSLPVVRCTTKNGGGMVVNRLGYRLLFFAYDLAIYTVDHIVRGVAHLRRCVFFGDVKSHHDGCMIMSQAMEAESKSELMLQPNEA